MIDMVEIYDSMVEIYDSMVVIYDNMVVTVLQSWAFSRKVMGSNMAV